MKVRPLLQKMILTIVVPFRLRQSYTPFFLRNSPITQTMFLKLQYNQMATVLIHQLEGWPERFLFFRCRAEGDRVSIDFETLQNEKPDSLTLIIVGGVSF